MRVAFVALVLSGIGVAVAAPLNADGGAGAPAKMSCIRRDTACKY
jgi:hypothetical protein